MNKLIIILVVMSSAAVGNSNALVLSTYSSIDSQFFSFNVNEEL